MHYRYPDDVRTIIRNCAARGANTVLWQVRGEATVAYPSALEPWSREYDHRDPGFDPLAIAVAEAHRYGLRLEAWVNVMPGWKGQAPPPTREQLYLARPEWFLHDERGRRQALSDYYVIVNPCLPAVRAHIAAVCREIASRYAVDGVHLDYIRYAWDTTPDARQQLPRDPQTLALYRSATGLHPDDDPNRWDRWRAEQLDALVRHIRTAVAEARPGATLTAAVWADPDLGYKRYLQDGRKWLARGWVDALMPMAYTAAPAEFAAHIAKYRAAATRGRIVPGVGLYKHDAPGALCAQLRDCVRWGGDYALFSYASLHPTAGDRASRPVSRSKQDAWLMRRAVLAECAPGAPLD